MTLQIQAPGPLVRTGNLAKNWKSFKASLDNFMIATEYDGKSDKIKIALLLSCIGTDWQETYNAFVYAADGDKDKYDNVVKKFEEYCNPKANTVFERHVFFSRTQTQD